MSSRRESRNICEGAGVVGRTSCGAPPLGLNWKGREVGGRELEGRELIS